MPAPSCTTDIETSTGRIAFGLGPIDDHLGGGLQVPALHEIDAVQNYGVGLLLSAFLAARSGRPVVWVRARADLFAPALAQAGLSPARVTHVETWKERHILAAAEEALRAGQGVCVVAEAITASLTATRRLHLAAKATDSFSLLIRTRPVTEGSAALTRWRAEPLPAQGGDLHRLPRAHWRLGLVRARSCPPASWTVRAPDASGTMVLADESAQLHRHPSARLADRPDAPAAGRTAA